jgi:cob(I)alamin adenosyltransferase
MSSITTRRGDTGRTQLYSGEEVSKADLMPRAVGTLDEAVSVLGLARSICNDPAVHDLILDIQRASFVAGAEMATHPDKIGRLKQRVDEAFMQGWELRRDALEAKTEMPRDFVIPGGTPVAAHLDHARTVFRRCEREAVALWESGFLKNPLVLRWLNRMSDLLWLLARNVEGNSVLPVRSVALNADPTPTVPED